jgi:hypothetical protein
MTTAVTGSTLTRNEAAPSFTSDVPFYGKAPICDVGHIRNRLQSVFLRLWNLVSGRHQMMQTERWRETRSIITSCTVLTGLAATTCFLTRGTQFEPFGVGLLAASVALLVAMAAFEIIILPTLWPLCVYLEQQCGFSGAFGVIIISLGLVVGFGFGGAAGIITTSFGLVVLYRSLRQRATRRAAQWSVVASSVCGKKSAITCCV